MSRMTDENDQCFFPLTSLQIGDLQSYLSHLSLFLAPETKKFFILVDNRPWSTYLDSRAAHLWQFMVVKSRLSPFANTKARRERKNLQNRFDLKDSSIFNTSKPGKYKRWSMLIDVTKLSQKKALLPEKLRNSLLLDRQLNQILYGFIVFEVAWESVRGINYLNELQTATCMAIEAKFMKRWEFESIEQASSSIPSWFSGTHFEQILLRKCLDSIRGDVFYDTREDFSWTEPVSFSESIYSDDDCLPEKSPYSIGNKFGVYPASVENKSALHTPPPATGPYKRRKIIKYINSRDEMDTFSKTHSEIDNSQQHSEISTSTSSSDSENTVEASEYRDVLILFRFNDHDLPFKLREIIMSDVRLLTLLESGLPSWVIFLQSYPVFCHLYRPWMCPLARESWEMISRIRYLGTMLFLHNFEKAVKWFLMVTHAIRSFLSVLTQPIGPFLEFMDFLFPIWNTCLEAVEGFCSVIWITIGSSCSLVMNLLEVLFSPLWFIISIIWRIGSSIIYPIFWALKEILYTPIRLVIALASSMAFICSCIFNLLGELWSSISSIFQIATASEAAVSTSEISMWRALWNDLFSQIFRAVRSILNGFIAFFIACNRHRLRKASEIHIYFWRIIHLSCCSCFRVPTPPSNHFWI